MIHRTRFKQPVLTYALIAVNLMAFAVEFILGAPNNTGLLVLLGAKEVFRITAGQWWRLLTAMFLHGGIEHLLFNMLALYIWGRYAESMQGRLRYGIVYFTSGIAGGILSYAMSPTVSVGASGAIFGLFGSFLYLRVYNKEIFNRVFGIQVLILIAINLINGLFQPNIDLWGHVGGLVGGFLSAAACGLYSRQSPSSWRILAGIALIVMLGGLLAFGYGKYARVISGYPLG